MRTDTSSVPVQTILDRVHGHPGAVDRIIEASFREVDIQDGVIDVASEGGKDVVAVVVIHQLVRAVGLAPGIILQLCKVRWP